MRIVSFIMAATAVATVALSLGAVLADGPPVGGQARELQFELADGTVITGRIDVEAITIRTPDGKVRKVPTADLRELRVGLNDRPGAPEAPARPVGLKSSVRTGKSALVGTITVKQFRITGPYGRIAVKLEDLYRIRPGSQATSGKPGRRVIELRDKTRIKGMVIGQPLRVRTRCGTIVVPFDRIRKATFSSATDGKSVRVQCWNFDRITGALRPGTTISLKTDKGRVDLPVEKIAAVLAPRLDLDLGKGVKMKLVLVPAGKFVMGSPKTDGGRDDDEGPQREVTISGPFYMGIYEVTQAQWRAVMGAGPWDGRYAQSGAGNAASYISWDDASKFCRTLSKKTHRKVALPTEAQWEYACRAGGRTAYCFGDNAGKLGDYAWNHFNGMAMGEQYAQVAGQKKPNAWGLYDVHGNVWEWCRDWYDSEYYTKAKNVDPENTRKTGFRVLRGGSFVNTRYCRSANRDGYGPAGRYFHIGFRVLVSAGGAKNREGTCRCPGTAIGLLERPTRVVGATPSGKSRSITNRSRRISSCKQIQSVIRPPVR